MTLEPGNRSDQSSDELANHEDITTVLKIFADSDSLGIVVELLEQPSTQKQLSEQLRANSSTISRKMSTLEEAELVTRERSHGPYRLTRPEATFSLLLAEAELGLAAAERAVEDRRTWRDRLNNLSHLYTKK
jgi:DNA-binding IclR family transcriptional regulator